jgi:hypothetical protein
MATQIYRNLAGDRLPSVTTIIGRFKVADPLIHWAWNLGMEGKDYKKERQKAADSGTIAHQMVEAHLKGEEWTPQETYPNDVVERGKTAFSGYLKWAAQSDVQVLHSEVPLVSEKYQFGGCLDATGKSKLNKDGGLQLLDWKSSNAIYTDYLYQLAAYALLWDETYPDMPITGGFHLCRFSKDTGDFEHRFYESLEDEKQAFLKMRELYGVIQKVEKVHKRKAA